MGIDKFVGNKFGKTLGFSRRAAAKEGRSQPTYIKNTGSIMKRVVLTSPAWM